MSPLQQRTNGHRGQHADTADCSVLQPFWRAGCKGMYTGVRPGHLFSLSLSLSLCTCTAMYVYSAVCRRLALSRENFSRRRRTSWVVGAVRRRRIDDRCHWPVALPDPVTGQLDGGPGPAAPARSNTRPWPPTSPLPGWDAVSVLGSGSVDGQRSAVVDNVTDNN